MIACCCVWWLPCISQASHSVLKCCDLMCQQPPLAYFGPQRNNKAAWLHQAPPPSLSTHRIGSRIRLLSFSSHAWGKQRAGVTYYCHIPTGSRMRWEPGLSSHLRRRTQPLTCWSSAGIQARSDATSPPSTPTLFFLQNNNNKPKSNLATKTTPVGVTNVQGPSPASFPTVLFITFPSLTYSPQLPPPPPSPLLSAWNRHSGKYILCKLSSCCYSWFHKWWWNGQESEGVNGKRWLLHAMAVFLRSSFFIDNRAWLENSRWEGQH